MVKVTTCDIPTFCAFLAELDSTRQVRDFVEEYAGNLVDANAFAVEFVKRLNSERNGRKLEVWAEQTDFQAVKNRKAKK